jgi:hypothetical protein
VIVIAICRASRVLRRVSSLSLGFNTQTGVQAHAKSISEEIAHLRDADYESGTDGTSYVAGAVFAPVSCRYCYEMRKANQAEPIWQTEMSGDPNCMLSFRVATANRGASMSLEFITKQIREEISKLDQVVHLLERGARKTTRASARRRMSAAARKRISAAQKARWKKVRAAKK